jgi:chaperonin GroES
VRVGDIAAIGPDVKHVKVGSTVLYSKFGIGCVDLLMKGQDYVMIKEQDLIGVLPNSGARANDIPKMTPCGDRILVAIDKVMSSTKGGILLTEGAKEKPVTGTVVSVGPGKVGEDGETKPMAVKAGDKVIYFKYAGDQMTDEEGNGFVVLHESDVLAKL